MSDEDPCKGATFERICRGIEAVRKAIGSPTWPSPDFSSDPLLNPIEVQLASEPDAPLSRKALIIAEGLRQIGDSKRALMIADTIPQLVASSEAANAALLGQAMIIRARSLDALQRPTEANSAFALAEHFHTLAGRTQLADSVR